MNTRKAAVTCFIVGFLALIAGYFLSGCATSTRRLADCAELCTDIARKNPTGSITITTEKHECQCELDFPGTIE